MPKFASTLASLLLIASSIGVNIARYPQVGRTVGSGPPADPAKTADSYQSTIPADGVETASQKSSSSSAIASEPAKLPQVAAAAHAGSAKVEEASNLSPVAGQAPVRPQPAVPILDVRPMLPIATLRAASAAPSPAGYDEVQRLPPVDPGVSAITGFQSAGIDRAEPYPTTTTP